MLVMDLRARTRLGAGMDEADIDLIKRLCTKIGCIMEDGSVLALHWSSDVPLETRINELSAASDQISALAAAAQALLSCQA